jgi:hypothetical protein
MQHDLALARAERIETLPEHGQCPITLPAGTIASEAGLDSVKKILVTERLCEELYRTALHRLHGHWHVGVGCDEDNRHLPVCGGEVVLKLKTASSQHSHVEYQASRAVRRICLQELGGQKKRACRPTVRNSRATESRNSGSSSMTETLGFALPIPGILRKESAFFPLERRYSTYNLSG